MVSSIQEKDKWDEEHKYKGPAALTAEDTQYLTSTIQNDRKREEELQMKISEQFEKSLHEAEQASHDQLIASSLFSFATPSSSSAGSHSATKQTKEDLKKPTSKPQTKQLPPPRKLTSNEIRTGIKQKDTNVADYGINDTSTIDKKVANLGIVAKKRDTGIPLSLLKASAKLGKKG